MKLSASFPWGKWLSLYCAFSFTMLGIDVAMNHHEVIHETPYAYIPILYAIFAIIACSSMVFMHHRRRMAIVVGVIGLLVGGAGMLFHNIPTITERGHQTIWHVLINNPVQPVFAPASFAATALLLLLLAWGEAQTFKNGATVETQES